MSLARLWRSKGKPQQARELAGSGLRLVHGKVRPARPEGGEAHDAVSRRHATVRRPVRRRCF